MHMGGLIVHRHARYVGIDFSELSFPAFGLYSFPLSSLHNLMTYDHTFHISHTFAPPLEYSPSIAYYIVTDGTPFFILLFPLMTFNYFLILISFQIQRCMMLTISVT